MLQQLTSMIVGNNFFAKSYMTARVCMYDDTMNYLLITTFNYMIYIIVYFSATKFAVEMGFKESDLSSNKSDTMYKQWIENNCQPNYRVVR